MKLNINNANFEISAVSPKQYPASHCPEIAFVGRSNVGKSTFINMMLNRKNIARVSSTPGKTREINFYNIDKKLYFVDLPGYGYAKISKEKKEKWGEVLETYLHTRHQLGLIIFLVDIRHTPSEEDRIMCEWIKSRGKKFVVLASKLDKISRNQIKVRIEDIRKTLKISDEVEIIPYSAQTKKEKDYIWEMVEKNIIL